MSRHLLDHIPDFRFFLLLLLPLPYVLFSPFPSHFPPSSSSSSSARFDLRLPAPLHRLAVFESHFERGGGCEGGGTWEECGLYGYAGSGGRGEEGEDQAGGFGVGGEGGEGCGEGG